MSKQSEKLVSEAKEKIEEALNAVARCHECLTNQYQVDGLKLSAAKLAEGMFWLESSTK